MRLWSIHPEYLDPRGLVALWREALLAQQVLLGLTQGYRSHPQLTRFRAAPDPVRAIGCYLQEVAAEAGRRGYAFDGGKIVAAGAAPAIPVTRGQVAFEWDHLLRKFSVRAPALRALREGQAPPRLHPLFTATAGGMEEWERG